jgi:segregation and condensation protein B
MIEAMLFTSDRPLTKKEMSKRMPNGFLHDNVIERLQKNYKDRGLNLMKVADGYIFRSAPDLSFLLQNHVKEYRKLSKAALEILAIIAYHESSTRAEIEEIRGVSVSTGSLDLLMELGWIALGKRRKTPGLPITFVITKGFLEHFGLESVKDLPGMNELRETGLLCKVPVDIVSD